jgi:6-phosphogluconolactonase
VKSYMQWSFLFASVLGLAFASLPGQAQARHRSELAFVANQSSNNLSAYALQSNGSLLPVTGSPFAAGGAPNSVTIVPSGLFVYVADVVPGSVSGFSVAQNGVLTPIPGSPFAAPTGTAFVTNDPSGRFLYALNCGSNCSGSGSGDISAYTIDPLTGVLTPIAGSPFTAGEYPYALAIDPTGHFAYVANAGSGDVYSFSIDSQSGALTQVGLPAAAGSRPISVEIDPWSQYVYTANTGSSNVSAFSINFDGSLSAVVGSPFAVGSYTAGVSASKNGKYVIVAAGAGAYVYSIDNSGALHHVGSPVAAGTGPNGVSIDPNDGFVYIVNAGSNNVSAYTFNDTSGKLTPVAGSPFSAGAFAAGLGTSPAPLHQ